MKILDQNIVLQFTDKWKMTKIQRSFRSKGDIGNSNIQLIITIYTCSFFIFSRFLISSMRSRTRSRSWRSCCQYRSCSFSSFDWLHSSRVYTKKAHWRNISYCFHKLFASENKHDHTKYHWAITFFWTELLNHFWISYFVWYCLFAMSFWISKL